jgi:hypothetical protein
VVLLVMGPCNPTSPRVRRLNFRLPTMEELSLQYQAVNVIYLWLAEYQQLP